MYKADIITDSIADNGVRLTTMQVVFPRFILSEFNTARVFSRNSASSRAIPIAKRIKEVQDNPFVPEAFTANQKGMQGGPALEGAEADAAIIIWRSAVESAVKAAKSLERTGVHKQYVNRVLEPYLWHTVVITATDWSNFFAQRCHPDAQPEIRRIAEMIRDAMAASTPRLVRGGGTSDCWHLPYVTDEDRATFSGGDASDYLATARRVSVARCARVSYLSQNGKREIAEDLALYERLTTGMHFSPFEHVATPAERSDHQSGNFRGWVQFRKCFQGENR